MTSIGDTLTDSLQRARKARRISQLELSMRLGVSQRHVSFVESGRARPSRALLLSWLREIDAPLALSNAVMLQAGYAPAYGAAETDDPALAQANAALGQLLAAHDPNPAFVLDALWTVRAANRGGSWLAAVLMPWILDLPADQPLNMLDALCHPAGPIASVTNLAESGPALLAHLRHEAASHPALEPKVEAFAATLAARLAPRRRSGADGSGRPMPPVLTTRFATPFGDLSFFSMFTTFGTPQDISLASLRVEHVFPADPSTAEIVRREVGRMPT